MDPKADTVQPKWLTWPAAVVAALAWCLGRLTHVAFFDLVVVAALTWLAGWLLMDFVGRYLIRSGQIPPVDGEDPLEDDRQR
jgi:hypothetical protein